MDKQTYGKVTFTKNDETPSIIEVSTDGGTIDVEYATLLESYNSMNGDQNEVLTISGMDGSTVYVHFDALRDYLADDICMDLISRIRRTKPELLIEMADSIRAMLDFKDDEELLEDHGWEILNDEPIEVRHRETGDICTGLAVSYLLAALAQKEASQN